MGGKSSMRDVVLEVAPLCFLSASRVFDQVSDDRVEEVLYRSAEGERRGHWNRVW
jgi:hypothetical protein